MTAVNAGPPEVMPADGAAASRWLPRESAVVLGVAQADITPEPGVAARNWGAARHDLAVGVHRPLMATAVAVAEGNSWRYLVTCDLGWWQSEQTYRSVHEPLCVALGVSEDQVLLHLAHTHAGPSLADRPGEPGAETIGPYRQQLVAALINAASEARGAAMPATVTWSYGRCDLAVVRDLACGERDIVGFDPTATADDTLLVGRVSDGSRDLAVLVNYACHPTTLAWENDLLSPDFVGAAREIVEKATGATVAFLQGASGELSPREQYTGGTDLADRNGRILGHAVMSVLETMGEPATELRLDGVVESGAPLAIWRRYPASSPAVSSFERLDVPVPPRPPLLSEEISAMWSHIDPVAAAERAGRASRLAEGYPHGAPTTHPVLVWRLGDAVIVAHPGEAYSVMQTELRRRHPEFAVAVLNLTNGPGFMYLPDADAYDHDRYQVWQTLLQRGALESVIEAVDAVIDRLAAPRVVST